MPNEKVLQSKKELVLALTEKLQNAVSGVIVDYKGISVADDTKLRKELREAGVDYFVVKNTMLRFAAKNANLEELNGVLEGTTAIALSQDAVAPAKILAAFADKQKDVFNIKAGFVEGKVLSVDGVNELAKLPSREVLIAKALGGLNAPISGFANVLNANLRGLVIALNQIAEKQSA
ncbi:MAG TPA: 50S ribosomal protein L10 [Firmicutes bacterium]|nr:50S ribosomal protein L10 [Bacillota bacterium]